MTLLLAALCVVLAVAVVMLALRVQRDRAHRKQRNLFGRWPIRSIPLDELDPAFAVDTFGPTRAAEVSFIGRGTLDVPGGTSDTEAWILATLARRARLMFEFGTCSGKTTYLWAKNSSPETKVVTITLGPDDVAQYHADARDEAHDTDAAIAESAFARFMYSGTEVEGKVEQLFGDSKAVNVSPWAGRCDVVFVDGSHAYSYVMSDSRKALELVRPGGVILWHDYLGPKHSPGVYRALNELAREIDLVHVKGTSFVAHRKTVR